MARAIRDGWREYFVGRSAIQLILGNMAFPERLHRKLADTGAELQKSDTPETGRRPNNLDGPIETIEATGGSSFSRRCRWRAS